MLPSETIKIVAPILGEGNITTKMTAAMKYVSFIERSIWEFVRSSLFFNCGACDDAHREEIAP